MGQIPPRIDGDSNSAGLVNAPKHSSHQFEDLSALSHNTPLLENLGIPTSLLFKTSIANKPPSLPHKHFSRSSIFPTIAKKFDSNRTIVVFGYPESGKTTAIAEFATEFPGDVFWFSVSSSETDPDALHALFCYSLAQYLEVDSFLPETIRQNLEQRQSRLLIVIDNAQFFPRLNELSFVFEAAETTPYISILLVGRDEPDFLSAIRTRGIVNWRLPGLSEKEAQTLIELTLGPLSDTQVEALSLLSAQVGGHLGMLKLSGEKLCDITSVNQLELFIEKIKTLDLGAGPDALRLAMHERLRENLGVNEFDLCRRLSLILGDFPKRVAERLWNLDRLKEEFHQTWNRCVFSVFEGQPSGNYGLPDLYQGSFQQEINSEEIKKSWHSTIADAFAEEHGGPVDIQDIYKTVIHRLLSGDIAAALESAAMYLLFASGPHSQSAQKFLIHRFAIWLKRPAETPTVSAASRITWYSTCFRTYSMLGLHKKATAAAQKLHDLLCTPSLDVVQETLLLGWTSLLSYASSSGKPDIAQLAIEKLEQNPICDDEIVTLRLELLVISAYLNSSESPLSYIQGIIEKQKNENSSSQSLWGEMHGYEFWRTVTALIYSKNGESKPTAIQNFQFVDKLKILASSCREINEFEIACLVECVLVHAEIDLLRNFQEACDTAHKMLNLEEKITDKSVLSYIYDTFGDALRCNSQDDEAITVYLKSLGYWPDFALQGKAETQLMLGISLAKTGRFYEGANAAWQSAELYNQQNDHRDTVLLTLSTFTVARCLLEAAGFSIHGELYAKACRYLISAHRLLHEKYRDRSEWVALGQTAWSLLNKLNSAATEPRPPAPGFTLGLEDSFPGAEEMTSSAPTMMLARACTAVGRPHRAMEFFDSILDEHNTLDSQMHLGMMAVETAIEVQDLSQATKYVTLGSNWFVIPSTEIPKENREDFVFHFLTRTLKLALKHRDKQRAITEINQAISILQSFSVKNPVIDLFSSTLQSYYNARANGDVSVLKKSFRMALNHKALGIARDIAWYACWRVFIDVPVSETQYVLWRWRLYGLSFELGFINSDELSTFLEEEHHCWKFIQKNRPSENSTRILKTFNALPSTESALEMLVDELAIAACKISDIRSVLYDIALQLKRLKNVNSLAKPLDVLYVRLLNCALNPETSASLSPLQENLMLLLEGLELSKNIFDKELKKFKGIKALFTTFESAAPSDLFFTTLYNAYSRSSELNVNSTANLCILLRHSGQYSQETDSFQKVCEILISNDITELLKNEDLLPQIKTRLSICRLAAKGFTAYSNLIDAISVIETQKNIQSPIAFSALESNKKNYNLALEELKNTVSEFDVIKQQTVDDNLNDGELGGCCFDLGSLRLQTASILLRQGSDEATIKNWLKPSMIDFQEAIKASERLDSKVCVEQTLKSAFSGQKVADVLKDKQAREYFTKTIENVRSTGRYEELIADCETNHSASVSNLFNHQQGKRTPLKPNDEDDIQFFTDQLMKATGLPQDRRMFVEDDIRKNARIEQEQEEYCQHLQPLQDFHHTHSPHTAYASPTEYTCSCTLLGYETRIEGIKNIETVIDTMKQIHCKDCQQRSPKIPE